VTFFSVWIGAWCIILAYVVVMDTIDDLVWWFEHDWVIDWTGPLDGPARERLGGAERPL